jgi:hypothetical protein
MIGCEKCGRTDWTLRASTFLYTVSVLVMTFRRPAGEGIYCSSCRKKEAFKWTLVSAIFGWWGFPWGPVYTFQAIGRNVSGGYQSDGYNAELLKAVAAELVDEGDQQGAIWALETSLQMQDDPDARQALWSLHGEADTAGADPAVLPPVSPASLDSFAPGALVCSANGDVPMHVAPESTAEHVGSLGGGTAVVTRSAGAWVELQIPGGKAGWVSASAIVTA